MQPGRFLSALPLLPLLASPARAEGPRTPPSPAPAASTLSAPADLVLVGGKVWPGRGLPRATALAIRGGRVVVCGSDADALAQKGPATKVVELGGRLVVPGFNDAHVHFLAGGAGLLSVDLRPSRDEADLARLVGEYATKLPAGRWIVEGYWDHESWPSRRLPTKASIDPATPRNPVFVSRLDGHMGLANSLALKAAGITKATPDPPGGTIVRDAAGEPTGILKDNAMDLVAAVLPPPTHAENLDAARAALKEAARFGVTSVQDNSGPDALRTYLDLAAKGELTVRVNVWQGASFLDHLLAAGITGRVGDEWVRIGAVKILADGSMGSGTAAFFAPYADDPKTTGLLLYPVPEIERLVEKADRGGFQVAVHAIGDRANALVLDAFAKAAAANGPRDRRPRVEHAQVVRAVDLPRWKALGAVASVEPSHAADDLRWARRRIGGERLADAYRLRSFLAAGIPVAFGTDWGVETLDPRTGLYAAVTKAAPPGVAPADWPAAERISLEEALDLYGRGSAWAEFEEREKGTLEPGRLADLVVFGEDLFALEKSDPRRILAAPIDLTVVGGRIVFAGSAADPAGRARGGRP